LAWILAGIKIFSIESLGDSCQQARIVRENVDGSAASPAVEERNEEPRGKTFTAALER
jgi:hypothetical protein